MKFKVGDKVRVKSIEWYNSKKLDYGFTINDILFDHEMAEYCGRLAVVEKLGEAYYKIDIDKGEWFWYDWMLEDETQLSNTESTGFEKILQKMLETYKAKNADYGNSFDKTLNEFGLVAATVRLSDKMDRIKRLTKNEAKVLDESIEDTLLDLANYSVMALVWLKNKEK